MKLKLAAPVLTVAALAACSPAQSAAPGVIAADPWVRATVGTEMPEMTALFVNLTNPSKEEQRSNCMRWSRSTARW